ncbi:hypothetical protein G7Z12_09050 [Streptomyces sp. ID38640]|uniref:hypothetical protein n=1 Tax=Streptomyces sp. ID38640 TaxID=1265399 RepID=UPI00140ED39C|nr:hypothetical protein [Streptomyces sp. ID38640]QIK06150.1 hypothetical protein G7Z12_09050 [Streptomyces sp. ID38640]
MSAAGVPEYELERLRPGDVAHYLRGRGWQEGGRVRYSRRWELEQGGRRRRVLLPMDTGLADYTDRMADLIEDLSAVEGRPPAAIHQDLTLTGLDVQYVRMLPATPSGTIPVPAGVLAVTGARDLLMAAACDALSEEPRLVQPRRKPDRAKALVDSARFGPSIPGSYILTLQVPLPEIVAPQGLLFEEDPAWQLAPEPFARKVSRRMCEAVSAARTAALRAAAVDDSAPFVEGARRGISADLCEALAGIGGYDGRTATSTHAFSLGFAWSPRWPVPEVTPTTEFTPALVGVLREAAQDLRRQEPELGVTVVGRTTKLKRAADFGPGEVTVEARLLKENGDLGGQQRQIHLHLREEDYDRATDAHRERRDLKIQGDLVRRGTYHELTGVTGFDVL